MVVIMVVPSSSWYTIRALSFTDDDGGDSGGKVMKTKVEGCSDRVNVESNFWREVSPDLDIVVSDTILVTIRDRDCRTSARITAR